MGNHRFPLIGCVLAWSSLAGLVGCGPGSSCGCTPAPTGTVAGRITDAQGQPLAGVEVWAVQLLGSAPPIGISVVAKGGTRSDGTFLLQVGLGSSHLFIRGQAGSATYLPSLGPEFALMASGDSVAGMNLELTPTNASDLLVNITPVHGAQQEDDLSLDQTLTLGGLDYKIHVASVKPSPTGGLEMVQFLKQPPGTYTLSLQRSETTGTHPRSGTAKATFTLPEGSASSVTLAVN